MRGLGGVAGLGFALALSGCDPYVTVRYLEYQPEGQCWYFVSEEKLRSEWGDWDPCDGGDFSIMATDDGRCLQFGPVCGPLIAPELAPCETVEGCCESSSWPHVLDEDGCPREYEPTN